MRQAEAKELTHGRVLRIAIPIVLTNASVAVLGVVDTGVIGQLGQATLIGAVGIGSIVIGAVYWIFGFLRMGTVGLTSQAIGAEDTPEVDALLTRVLMIAALAGVALILFQSLIFWAALTLAPASDAVEEHARTYMSIRIFSAPAAIGLYGVTGWLIAAERTRETLYIQLVMNGLNIVLNLWFVLGLGFEVAGVAWATFIAEWTGLALALRFCRSILKRPHWQNWTVVFDRARLWNMASVNSDIVLRSVMLQIGFLSFIFYGSKLGDVELAANQILYQFVITSAFAMDGFAIAAETLVGQAMGAKDRGRLRRSAQMTAIWSAGIGACLMVLFFFFGHWAIDLMTTAADVRDVAKGFLIYMILTPLAGALAWMLDGIFIGATRTRDMRNMMFVSCIVYFAALLAFVPSLGNHGLWIAMLIWFIARGITLATKYPALERAAERPA